jgi:hypothetical protein
MNSRNSKGSGYTAGVERPSADRAISLRGAVGLALTVLLPPVGLFFLWRRGIFRTRGRMLLTGLAALEMTALVVLLTPHQELTPRLPVPAPPAQVTPSPTEEVLTALYNSEELVYQSQLEQVKASGGTERDLMTEEEKLEMANDETEAIYDTIVYSVYGNEAVYYHATKVCRTQTNGRELTVRDALREGLEPCPNCNPPSVDS